MKKAWILMVVGMVAGAVVMYGSRFVKIRIEDDRAAVQNGGKPEPKPSTEPGRLPAEVFQGSIPVHASAPIVAPAAGHVAPFSIDPRSIALQPDLPSPRTIATGTAPPPLPPIPRLQSTSGANDPTKALVPSLEQPTGIVVQKRDGEKPTIFPKSASGTFLSNSSKFQITGSIKSIADDGTLIVLRDDLSDPVAKFTKADLKGGTTWLTDELDAGSEGIKTLRIGQVAGTDKTLWKLSIYRVDVRLRGPNVYQPSPLDFSLTPGLHNVTLQFSTEIDADTLKLADNYSLTKTDIVAGQTATPLVPTVLPGADQRSVILQFAPMPAGTYELKVLGIPSTDKAKPSVGIRDTYGNYLSGDGVKGTDYKAQILKPAGDVLPSVSRGVTFQPAPPVTFPEFTPPRKVPEGFNPADKVETRVARLFYNRDAHRVAQIVNRDVKSYNRATVDVRRRAADATRDNADRAQDERQKLEQQAVLAAQASRALEAKLAQLQAQLQDARNRAASNQDQFNTATFRLNEAMRDPKNDLIPFQSNVAQSKSNLDASVAEINTMLPQQIATVTGQLTAARDKEAQSNEAAQTKTAEERRLREEQFRREVAAAKEDPDTYVAGDPKSDDPVKQVSVSVVGEGLIQLRGPMKGINVVRIMINQMDAPVGQVRVGVHTVQVNGERGDRMEKVVADIQRYIDQSRFMTSQTAELLRKAIVRVASQKASESGNFGDRQPDRDARYLTAFFGKDFIDELKTLDSEFLMTGNKLLSLHSMDSTSLSAALLLMALAKNSVRSEILMEFDRAIQQDLPGAEMNFLLSGSWSMCKSCKKGKCCHECFLPLAGNAKFQSLLGFFNGELIGSDTMSPLQREFIRLAQIYKARLITELELKQRVLERSLVEERLGQSDGQNLYLDARRKAKKDEDDAQEEARKAADELERAMTGVIISLQTLANEVEQQGKQFDAVDVALHDLEVAAISRVQSSRTLSFAQSVNELNPSTRRKVIENLLDGKSDPAQNSSALDLTGINLLAPKLAIQNSFSSRGQTKLDLEFADTVDKRSVLTADQTKMVIIKLESILQVFALINFGPLDQSVLAEVKDILGEARLGDLYVSKYYRAVYCCSDLKNSIREYQAHLHNKVIQLQSKSREGGAAANFIISEYPKLRMESVAYLAPDGILAKTARDVFIKADQPVNGLSLAQARSDLTRRRATNSRSPLDHKKFLDLLIDDTEDKYIEQLEGTRSHCANIDNYLKRLATALDDDFARQFYQPMFRCVREASRSWDVTLGQVETTTILTNNRAFAKVSPAASFEFDLPKRDIVIVEAMKGAKAMMDDYGALLNDPTFLTLMKLRSGSPTSASVGNLLNGSPVRNILPGLPSTSDEQVLAQGGSGRREFNSQLEALVPDPAIYKLETGTGFEIRPVMSPDGQSVVFEFDYMYTTKLREPVRADEKHLGKVDRHFVHTDVQLGNYELREISKYNVGLKVSRTGQGVQLLQDIPGVGILFRPAPSAGSSLQQNIILGSATIFPTLFDLTGLRYAPAIANLDPMRETVSEFIYRNREEFLKQQVTDRSAQSVDEALRIPFAERRPDLYRPQRTLPVLHPDGYRGPGLNRLDAPLREGYSPNDAYPVTPFAPTRGLDGNPYRSKLPTRPGDYSPFQAPSNGGWPLETGTRLPPGHGFAQPRKGVPPGYSEIQPPNYGTRITPATPVNRGPGPPLSNPPPYLPPGPRVPADPIPINR